MTGREGVRVVEVAVAGSEMEAEIWMDALQDAGIRAARFPRGVHGGLGGPVAIGTSFVVVVPEDRLGEARSVIAGIAGGQVLRPLNDREPRWPRVFPWLVGAFLVLLAAVLVVERLS